MFSGAEPFCAILVRALYGTIMLNNFELRPVVQEEMSLKDISNLEVWQSPCSVEQNHLWNFGRRHHEEKFCEIILNSNQWFRRCHLNIFLIWSFGRSFVQQSRTICEILVKGIMRNISVKLF